MSDPKPPSPASILDLAYGRASNDLDKALVSDSDIEADVEFVCRSSNLAGTRFLMACLVAKLSNPSFDVRKPYTVIGGEGIYSGRHYVGIMTRLTLRHLLSNTSSPSIQQPAF